jgi:hypothetical protein
MRFLALSLSTLLLARVASAQGPDSPARMDPPRRAPADVSVGTSMTANFLRASRTGENGWGIAPSAPSTPGVYSDPSRPAAAIPSARLAFPDASVVGAQAWSGDSISVGRSPSDAFIAIGSVRGDVQTPDQLLASFGLRNLSIRVGSWRAVGHGAERGHSFEVTRSVAKESLVFIRVDSVHRDEYELVRRRPTPDGTAVERTSIYATSVGFVRGANLSRCGSQMDLGGDVTAFRFGSRFDPAYGRHPVLIRFFVRIRFGSHGDGQRGNFGHSMSI